MKKNLKKVVIKVLLFVPLLISPVIVKGQAVALTQYFQPGYNMRHMLNPALMPQWGYVNFPALGLVNLKVGSNMGLSNFLFPLEDGSLTTFMNPKISPDNFLKKLKQNNYVQSNIDLSILSVGWYWGKGFWSVDLGAHVGIDMNLPYELFHFIKSEMYDNPTSYNIENMAVNVQAYTSLAVGYAREISPQWHVGGKLKFLYGAADVRLKMDKMSVYMSEDRWNIKTDANVIVAGPIVDFDTDSTGKITNLNYGYGGGQGGYGAAIDLGFVFKPNQVRGLRFSLGVTDLGFIYYNKESVHRAKSQGEFDFTGFENLGGGSDFSEQTDKLKDDLVGLMNLYEVPAGTAYTRMLNARLNAGLEYDFFMDKFSIGLLSSTLFNKDKIITELTVSLNMKVIEWLSLSVSYSMLQTQQTIGWALNITPKWGLNLFLASDYTPLVVNPQFIPLNKAHFQVMFGLSIPIGNNRLNPYKKSSGSQESLEELPLNTTDDDTIEVNPDDVSPVE